MEVEQSKRRRETTANGMQRLCDEIEIETAHPAADDDISEEIVEEKQKQEKSQEE